MTATVAVVGGGYGGITAAKALDEDADVILIDPKDSFVHNVASLRAVVDPSWVDRMFFPYDGLLARGTVVRGLAVSVEPGRVRLSSGRAIKADYIVLATGTTYPFPAKTTTSHARAAKLRFRRMSESLRKCNRVLLLGAGPVGLELAGEIAAVWPHKSVTIVDPAPEILSGGFVAGFPPGLAAELRADLRRQLQELGVELVLGAGLRHGPPSPIGTGATFATSTWSGRSITADIWFRCHGREPATRHLGPDLAVARRMDGRVNVTSHLRLAGQSTVFAIGDINATGALDSAVVAIEQGELVAEQIRALIQGAGPLADYKPSQPAFLLPLGPYKGASYLPGVGILDAATTSQYKGADLFHGKYAETFGMA